MKLGVVAHTSIDHIINKDMEKITVGGPTLYAGLTLDRFGIDTKLITKVGDDFPLSNELKIGKECIVNTPTTRFILIINEYSRKLFLLARCEDISINNIVDADGYIISPVINEISIDTLDHIVKRSNFTFLDPQGFVRRLRDKECYIARTDLKIRDIDVIKVDEEEAFALTGSIGIDALMALDVKTAILTSKDRTIMLHKDRVYSVKIEPIKPIDSTGTGDIFAGAYSSSYMKDKDHVWAFCSAIAASLSALKSNKVGIDKIPSLKTVEEEAKKIHENIQVYA